MIKDIPSNSKVMGYPARDLKNLLREQMIHKTAIIDPKAKIASNVKLDHIA